MGRSFPFEALIAAIYRAAGNSERWPETIALITDAFGGSGSAFHLEDFREKRFSFAFAHNVDAAALSEYAAYYYQINPLNDVLVRQPEGAIVPDHTLIPKEKLHRSEFFNDYGRRYGIEGSLTAVLRKNGAVQASFGILRGAGSTEFDENHVSALQKLAPHLTAAIDLNRKLGQAKAARQEAAFALGALETAVFFLCEEGRVAYCNLAAENLLKQKDGLSLKHGRLRATDPASHSELARNIDNATRFTGDFGIVRLPRPSGKRELLAHIAPFPEAEESFLRIERSTVVLYVTDPEIRYASTLEATAMAYGLTASEARLGALLADGWSLKEAADLLGIAEVTARNQLSRAMGKTNTHRQGELIRLLLASRAPLLLKQR